MYTRKLSKEATRDGVNRTNKLKFVFELSGFLKNMSVSLFFLQN